VLTCTATAAVPMPEVLTDYCRVGGVSLADCLTPEQVVTLLEDGSKHAAERAKAMRSLEPTQRMKLSALALLHAHAATHGKGCALSHVRKGPHPNLLRDQLTVKIYRALSGDHASSDDWLISKSQELHRRRMSGGERPSPAMRRSFGALTLAERSSMGAIAGSERNQLELWSGDTFALKKSVDMDVRGLKVGAMLLVRGAAPPDGASMWFQARVRGFFFRCGLPPVLITYIATENGETDPAKLPTPTDSACFKHATRELQAAPTTVQLV